MTPLYLGSAHQSLSGLGEPGAMRPPDFSAQNPGPHGTRLTSIIGLMPPLIDAPVLTALLLSIPKFLGKKIHTSFVDVTAPAPAFVNHSDGNAPCDAFRFPHCFPPYSA